MTGWYLRTLAERGQQTTGTTARAALAVLVDFLPDRQRAEMVREFRRGLERQAKAAGVPLPAWTDEL
ncbi:MAG TPA: hypothetical protein VHN15_00975, partial [Thermoanaerobaculia bacterium]|nr:hypothetical protein [Thermoanaerobaculia bacterium]